MSVSVDNLAKDHRGFKTWGFTQAQFFGRIVRMGINSGGICAGLSAHWIKAHALDEKSLPLQLGLTPATIKLGGRSFTYYRGLSIGKLRSIARDHNREMSRSVEYWLDEQGIAKRDELSKEDNDNICYTPMPFIEYKITDQLGKLRGYYAKITFGGSWASQAHAVAAWIGGRGEDACFFDPNYGEFWFEDRRDFFLFFRRFHKMAYCMSGNKLDGWWQVEAYSPYMPGAQNW